MDETKTTDDVLIEQMVSNGHDRTEAEALIAELALARALEQRCWCSDRAIEEFIERAASGVASGMKLSTRVTPVPMAWAVQVQVTVTAERGKGTASIYVASNCSDDDVADIERIVSAAAARVAATPLSGSSTDSAIAVLGMMGM